MNKQEKILKIINDWWIDDLTCAGKPTCNIDDCDLCYACFNRLIDKVKNEVKE